MIGEEVLLRASHGHVERMGTTSESIAQAFDDLGVDQGELIALFQELREISSPLDEAAYAGGVFDGFVLGVRAARLEITDLLIVAENDKNEPCGDYAQIARWIEKKLKMKPLREENDVSSR